MQASIFHRALLPLLHLVCHISTSPIYENNPNRRYTRQMQSNSQFFLPPGGALHACGTQFIGGHLRSFGEVMLSQLCEEDYLHPLLNVQIQNLLLRCCEGLCTVADACETSCRDTERCLRLAQSNVDDRFWIRPSPIGYNEENNGDRRRHRHHHHRHRHHQPNSADYSQDSLAERLRSQYRDPDNSFGL